MFKIIPGLPKNVLGIEAQGKITDADYRKILIPRANEMLAKYPAIRMLYVAGKDFKGYDARAVWDDAVFGLNHWSNFSCIAVVTDTAWLRTAAHLFSPFFPGVVKVFGLADLPAAKSWVAKTSPVMGKKKPDIVKKELVLPVLRGIKRTVYEEEKRMNKGRVRLRKKI